MTRRLFTSGARIGIDLDGVLADFNRTYVDILRESVSAEVPPISDSFPDEWGYDRRHTTDTERDCLWQFISNPVSEFWFYLDPLSPEVAAAAEICERHCSVYFITTRPGTSAKRQSERWLDEHLGSLYPTVLIADTPEAKGMLASGLQLTHFVDDRPENCEAVVRASPDTKVFLVDRPYNRDRELSRVSRISSLRDLAGELNNGIEVQR